jgi:hypothetical protein
MKIFTQKVPSLNHRTVCLSLTFPRMLYPVLFERVESGEEVEAELMERCLLLLSMVHSFYIGGVSRELFTSSPSVMKEETRSIVAVSSQRSSITQKTVENKLIFHA